jgi:hypothetical protein
MPRRALPRYWWARKRLGNGKLLSFKKSSKNAHSPSHPVHYYPGDLPGRFVGYLSHCLCRDAREGMKLGQGFKCQMTTPFQSNFCPRLWIGFSP